MKKNDFLLIGLICFAPLVLFAGENGFNYYINTGIAKAMATSEFKASYRSGVHVNIGVGKAFKSQLEGMFNLSFNHLTFDGRGFQSTFDGNNSDQLIVNGGPCGMLDALAGVKYRLGSGESTRAVSYVSIQGGIQHRTTHRITIYNPDADYDQIFASESMTHPLLNMGLGAEFTVENTTLFAELAFDVGFENDDNNVTSLLKFGLKL